MDSSKLQSLDPVELQREKPWRSHRGSTDPDPVAGDHVAHGVLQEGLWRGMAGVMFGHVRTQKMWSDWKLGENWRQKLITSYHNFMRNSEKPTRRDIFRPPRPPPHHAFFWAAPRWRRIAPVVGRAPGTHREGWKLETSHWHDVVLPRIY